MDPKSGVTAPPCGHLFHCTSQIPCKFLFSVLICSCFLFHMKILRAPVFFPQWSQLPVSDPSRFNRFLGSVEGSERSVHVTLRSSWFLSHLRRFSRSLVSSNLNTR